MSTKRSNNPWSFFWPQLTFRHFMTRGLLFAGLLVLLVGGAGLAWSLSGSKDHLEEKGERTLPVEVLKAKKVDSFAVRRAFTGVVAARRSSELSFRRMGELVEVTVDDGDRIEKGQILARLDSRQLLAKQQELLARKKESKARLEELVNGPRKQTIEAARAEVQDLQAQVSLTLTQHRRRENLFRRNAISQEEMDDSTFKLKAIQARLLKAQQQLDELEEGTRAEQIKAQQAVVARLDASLKDIAIEIEESALEAPFSGRVSKRLLDEGTVVTASVPVMEVLEDQHLEARIGVPVGQALSLQSGKTYSLLIQGQSHSATLRLLLPQLHQATRTRTALFDLKASHGIVPGQVARLEIEEQISVSGYPVPSTALIKGSRGLWSVYVVEKNPDGSTVIARRDVELLWTQGDHSLVRGTLQAGDQIVATGAHRVVPGQKVQLQQ